MRANEFILSEKRRRKKRSKSNGAAYGPGLYGVYGYDTGYSGDSGSEGVAEENLIEAFDQPYKLKWEKGDHGNVDALVKLPDGNYLSIMFNKGYSQGSKEEAWNVEFSRNNSQEVTGEGDAQRVFATVLSAIQTFIKKYKPNKVILAANKVDDTGHDSPSRAKLYDRLILRYAKAWGFRALRADTGNKVIYELSIIKPIVAKPVTEARVAINIDAPDSLYDIQDKLARSSWKSSVKNVITSLFEKQYPGVQLFFMTTQEGNLFITTDKTVLASGDIGLYSDTQEFSASIIGPTAEYGVDDILYVGMGFDSIKSGKYKGIVREMLNTIVPPLATKLKAKPAIIIVVEDQSAGVWEAMANKLGWAFISGEDEQGVAEEGYGNHPSQRVDPRTGKKYVPPKSPLGQGVAEGAAETSWSDGNEKITLHDILELTKHIKQINLPINDNLKNKLLHWDGNPEEIERINQVTVSNQFPILVMVDEQGQINWILDGNHRLHKAIKAQAKTIPAKLIKPGDLNDKAKKIFNIKEQGVAEENLTELAPSPLHHKLDPVLKQLSLKENLNENISPVVYHYRRIGSALKILQSGEFSLSSVLGSVEQEYAPKGYPYFLSTTRTRRGGYHRTVGSTAVLFVLDGTWFNQRYPGGSTDYWLNRNPQLSHHRDHEAEDRVFSRDPTIPITGVTGLHVYISSDADPEQLAQARKLLIAAKRLGIDTQLYRDKTAWRNFDTRNTADVGQLRGQERTGGRISTHPGYLLPWIQLLTAKDKSQLNKDADKIRYSLAYTYNREDAFLRLNTDLSNARKPNSGPDREHAVKIIQFMRRNNLDTVKDLVAVLAKKWRPEDKKVSVAEENLTEFAPSPDYRDDDRQDMPLMEFAGIIKLFLGSEYTMIDLKTPEQVSVKFDPKDKTSGHNGAVLYSIIDNKQNEYPTVNFHLIDYEQGPQVARRRRAGTAILKTRTNALKIADIIYNTMGLPKQDRKVKENFADGKVKGKSRPGRVKRAGVNCKQSVSKLRSIAAKSSGERQRMAHWCANMKSGKQK